MGVHHGSPHLAIVHCNPSAICTTQRPPFSSGLGFNLVNGQQGQTMGGVDEGWGSCSSKDSLGGKRRLLVAGTFRALSALRTTTVGESGFPQNSSPFSIKAGGVWSGPGHRLALPPLPHWGAKAQRLETSRLKKLLAPLCGSLGCNQGCLLSKKKTHLNRFNEKFILKMAGKMAM